jgi:monoamine oxidase
MQSNKRIILIGGGLSGLTLAYSLSKINIDVTILEASPRLGGRIQTLKGALETPLELGATWFSDIHQNLLSLLEELGLNKYHQFSKGKSLFQTKSFEPSQEFFVPESENPSYRIVGGTDRLIEKLIQKIPNVNIHLNTKVTCIKELNSEILLITNDGKKLNADIVILCMPPQLVASQIEFSPVLPVQISNILPTVQTWMSGSIKFVIEYDKPFWRNNGFSGMLYSHAGIVTEMYDHTNVEETKFGFTGFLNSGASSYSKMVREELVLQQLSQLLGNEILSPITYADKVWTDEFVYSGTQVIQRPHQNNGHPLLQECYMNGKLYFAGTEIATEFSGYMEGAIMSALKMAEIIRFR